MDWLKTEFGIGLKDYAVYWFRKAHECLESSGRAGIVATNSVSQGRARVASLDWIIENGGVITNAVSKQAWSGQAVVNVSIVNWVKRPRHPPAELLLDGQTVEGITAMLRDAASDVSGAERLSRNRGRAFQGPIPADDGGFILSREEAGSILSRNDADYRDVIRPYLTSDDIGQAPGCKPSRFIIDFGVRGLEETDRYPAAIELVRARVKPFRDKSRDKRFREKWWLFGRPRPAMRKALEPLDRFIAGTRHGVRLHYCWCEPWSLASDATNVFAMQDDYAIGVLSAKIHQSWAWAQSGTIRTDIRYSLSAAFETYPWPNPSDEQVQAIADLARSIIDRRQIICLERGIGLTQLYNEVDEGAYADLRQLHERLDESVADAYGWPKTAASDPDESNGRLLELNRKIAAGEVQYGPPSGPS